jgi:hypothetical protein
MKVPIINTIIPDNFIVQCPDRNSAFVHPSKACNDCQYFKGIAQISQDTEWHKCYRVLCGFSRVIKGSMIED